MQGCALVFARIPSLVLLRKTLGRALDCFPLENYGFPLENNHAHLKSSILTACMLFKLKI